MSQSEPRLRLHKGQRFSCVSCGKCCGAWEVPVTGAERKAIEGLSLPGWTPPEGGAFVKLRGSLSKISKRGGKCVYLDSGGLCAIHSHAGEAAKPLACRIYPFDIHVWEDGAVSASLRHDCPAVASMEGRPAEDMRKDILSFASELASLRAKRADASYSRDFKPGLDRLRAVSSAYRRILLHEAFAPETRIYAAARLLQFHSSSRNRIDIEDAGGQFQEDAFAFVERSVGDLEKALSSSGPPKPDAAISFRYVLTAFARRDEEASSWLHPLLRLRRVGGILSFIFGGGSLKEFGREFSDTKGIEPLAALGATSLAPGALDGYWSFLGARLEAMHFCGDPALRLSFEEGMRLLLLSYPAIRSFAAMSALARGSSTVERRDAIEALMIVDHGFARSPLHSLGHVRGIVRRLCEGDGLPSILKLTFGRSSQN